MKKYILLFIIPFLSFGQIEVELIKDFEFKDYQSVYSPGSITPNYIYIPINTTKNTKKSFSGNKEKHIYPPLNYGKRIPLVALSDFSVKQNGILYDKREMEPISGTFFQLYIKTGFDMFELELKEGIIKSVKIWYHNGQLACKTNLDNNRNLISPKFWSIEGEEKNYSTKNIEDLFNWVDSLEEDENTRFMKYHMEREMLTKNQKIRVNERMGYNMLTVY
tara:strand:- start:426 stop:1085 length:660 start_codon:yes stop_codon:yes gene_type:complete